MSSQPRPGSATAFPVASYNARTISSRPAPASEAAHPFADGEFDVVSSSFGAIFAPDHQAAANEVLRVCRPGGTIGMLS